MTITNEIESLFASLKAKVGALSTDVESHFANFLGLAKEEEAAHEAKVTAALALALVQAEGYIVTKPVEAVVGSASPAPAGPAPVEATPAPTV